MNWWQIVWRSIDEARIMVRFMVLAKLALFAGYTYMVTQDLFDMIEYAMEKNLDLGQMVSVITAITAFAGVTIPILANMVKDVWKDYRGSGIDWSGKGGK